MKNKNVFLAFFFTLIMANMFAESGSELFRSVTNRFAFYLVYSTIALLMLSSTFFIYSKLEKPIYKFSLCIIGTFLIPTISFVVLHMMNIGAAIFIDDIFSDVKVIIGLGIGSYLPWLPISLLWYFSFKKHYKTQSS
jgi:hypothetical protein